MHVDQVYPRENVDAYTPVPFRIIVAVMAAALIITVVLGIILAFRSARSRWLVWLSLVLGIVLPALLLLVGQRH